MTFELYIQLHDKNLFTLAYPFYVLVVIRVMKILLH